MSCEKYESGAGQAKQQQKARAHAVKSNLRGFKCACPQTKWRKVLPQNREPPTSNLGWKLRDSPAKALLFIAQAKSAWVDLLSEETKNYVVNDA